MRRPVGKNPAGTKDAQATAITPILTPRLWTRIRTSADAPALILIDALPLATEGEQARRSRGQYEDNRLPTDPWPA